MTRRHAVLLFCLFALSLLSACGKKEWPEPVLSEDRFTFKAIRAERKGGCLVVEVRVLGAVDNLSSLSVQLLEVGDGQDVGCPGCPFKPTRADTYVPGQTGLTRIGSALRVSVCDLNPDGIYLWRVMAQNQFPELGPVFSELFSSWPK
jgi:hypothetical protein